MSLSPLLEEAIESLEKPDLQGLLCALCRAASGQQFEEVSDERQLVRIIGLLLGFADYESRARAAEIAFELEDLPKDIYLYFACDDIGIAKRFLAADFPLSDENLMHVAKFGSEAHRLKLLERENLPPELVREIMRHNEVHVIRRMNENEETAIFFEYDDTFSVEARDHGLDEYSMDLEEELQIENPLNIMVKNYVDNSRFADLIEVLAQYGQLPKDTVKTMFSRKEAEPISILCKGLGLSAEVFADFARFRCRRLGQLERLGDQAITAYDGIDEDYATAMMLELKGKAPTLARRRTA